MKTRRHIITSAITAMLAAATFTSAGQARADSWMWSLSGHGLTAKAAAPMGNSIVALDANSYLPGSGYLVKKRHVDYAPWVSLSGWGTSVAVYIGTVYLVAEDNRVWKNEAGAWSGYAKNKCEGGDITIRQTVGDNNLAVSTGDIYVISGSRTRWWNGACWHQMPALPSGSPKDISPSPTNSHQIWAVNGSDTVYSWTGYAWTTITSGTSPGLADGKVIGSDDTSVWTYIGGSFTSDSTWPSGVGITQIAGDDGIFTAVTPSGGVYWYGYHND